MEEQGQSTSLRTEQIMEFLDGAVKYNNEREVLGNRQTVVGVKNFMFANYGEFISDETRIRVEGLEGNMLILSNKYFEKLYTQLNISPHYEEFMVAAFSVPSIGFMVFRDPLEIWQAAPEEFRQTVIDTFGHQDGIEGYFGTTILIDNMIHEVFHFFHAPGLPESFVEFGIRYYQSMLSRGLGLPDLHSTQKDLMLSRLYEHLVTRYGDTIHKIFFGQSVDEKIRLPILMAVSRSAKNMQLPFLN